jgi:hypothetical protein
MGAGVAADACVLSASRFRRIERRPQPTAANTLQQQDRFDAFVERYNRKRPHEGLAMHVPADVYTRRRGPTPAYRPSSTPTTIGVRRSHTADASVTKVRK